MARFGERTHTLYSVMVNFTGRTENWPLSMLVTVYKIEAKDLYGMVYVGFTCAGRGCVV